MQWRFRTKQNDTNASEVIGISDELKFSFIHE